MDRARAFMYFMCMRMFDFCYGWCSFGSGCGNRASGLSGFTWYMEFDILTPNICCLSRYNCSNDVDRKASTFFAFVLF